MQLLAAAAVLIGLALLQALGHAADKLLEVTVLLAALDLTV